MFRSQLNLTLRGITIAALILNSGASFAEVSYMSGDAGRIMPGCRELEAVAKLPLSFSRPYPKGYSPGECHGLIEGIAFLIDASSAGVCKPAVTFNQVLHLVVEYIDSRPTRL